MEALLGRQLGGLKGGQERVGQWAEGESAFGVRWRGLLHSPWGLEGSEVRGKRSVLRCCSLNVNIFVNLQENSTGHL